MYTSKTTTTTTTTKRNPFHRIRFFLYNFFFIEILCFFVIFHLLEIVGLRRRRRRRLFIDSGARSLGIRLGQRRRRLLIILLLLLLLLLPLLLSSHGKRIFKNRHCHVKNIPKHASLPHKFSRKNKNAYIFLITRYGVYYILNCIIIWNLVCFVFVRIGELLCTIIIIIIIINLEQSCNGKRRREVIASHIDYTVILGCIILPMENGLTNA